jgi:hypothetical protein
MSGLWSLPGVNRTLPMFSQWCCCTVGPATAILAVMRFYHDDSFGAS